MKTFNNFTSTILKILDIILHILYSILESLKSIFTFYKGFSKENDPKKWIFNSVVKDGTKDILEMYAKSGNKSKKLHRPTEFNKYVDIVAWICDMKDVKPYMNLFLRKVQVVILRCSSTWAFAYLKECMRLTVRALAGTPELTSFSDIRVGRDAYGLPRIIPLKLRLILREFIDYCKSNSLSPPAISSWGQMSSQSVYAYADSLSVKKGYNQKAIVGILTLLSIYRVFKTKVLPDFKTVYAPFTGFIKVLPGELVAKALRQMFPKGANLSMGKFKPFVSSNAGPNGKLALWSAGIDALAFMHRPKTMYSLLRWMYAQRAYLYIVWFMFLIITFGTPYFFIYFLQTLASRVYRVWHKIYAFLGIPQGRRYMIEGNHAGLPAMIYRLLLIFETSQFWRIAVGRFRGETNQLNLGKLGVVYDQAGKARVVASTNWWIQSCLAGLHKSIFDHLKLLSSDGTFDQDGCFDRFISKVTPGTTMSGFDLSAATDRLPIDLQVQVLNALGINGNLWKDLLDIDWYAPLNEDVSTGKYIKYSVGQPMGALSSWAMLALTHHVIVNVAQVSMPDQDGKPLNYAVLGDDFVINNDEVAAMYVNIMEALGLEIKLAKSVISDRFTEFAKKLRGPNLNFSPIGPGAILAACRSGYMIPSVFLSSIGNVISNPQEILDLVSCVPSGLVSRRDLPKYMSLVLWQLFNANGAMTQYVNRLGRDVTSLLYLNTDIFLNTASPIYVHIFDSMTNLYTKEMRSKLAAAHLPMVNVITNALPLLVTDSPTLRVLETLIKPFNPGFWIYLKDAFIAPYVIDKAWTDTFKTLPNGGTMIDDSYRNYWACINHVHKADGRLSILELKFTKSENKIRAKYFHDLFNDMTRRFKLSEAHELHRNWYEIGY
jgi:hypothetical protein